MSMTIYHSNGVGQPITAESIPSPQTPPVWTMTARDIAEQLRAIAWDLSMAPLPKQRPSWHPFTIDAIADDLANMAERLDTIAQEP